MIAGDGTILDHTGKAPEGVPEIKLGGDEKGGDIVAGDAVTGEALDVSRVLGAAPAPLRAEINGAETSKDYGVSVDIGPGLELRFGDASSADLKWKAAAAVLADPKFEGASYLDLSVPDRPVAGGVTESTASTDTAADPATDPAYVAPVDPALTTVP